MVKQYLFAFKNRIEWRFWYKSVIATASVFFLAVFSFSFWAVIFSLSGFLIAFFLHKEPGDKILVKSYWISVISFFVGLWFLVFKTTFFEFFLLPQALFFVGVFFFFLWVFLAKTPKFSRFPFFVHGLHVVLLFVVLSLSSFLLDKLGPIAYFIPFFGVLFLSQEILSYAFGDKLKHIRGFALFSGFLGAQFLFILRFLPFPIAFQAVLASVAFIIFFDCLGVHQNGKISARFLYQKLALFVLFFIFLSTFTKWTL